MRKHLKKLPAIPFLLTFAGLLLLCSCRTSQSSYINEANYTAPIRVACVGDSITYGAGISDREHNSYPAQLGGLLGPKWAVRNFGVNGATLLKKGDRPYWVQSAYQDALAFKPDVVIIKLGTNDSKPQNWRHSDEFVKDYLALIRSFEDLESHPRIYVCRPVPAFPERWGITDKVIREEVIPLTNEVADKAHVPVIDLYSALAGKADMFPDQIHPDARGAGIMARHIRAALTGRVASAL